MRVAAIATLIPLALIVGASSRLLVGNVSHVREAVAESQAFLAAESGIDAAMFRATTGSLTDGHFTTDMGRGMTHRVSYFDLGIDGIDNDTDGVIDETDEQVIRVLSVGLYGSSKTSLVAYLGRSIGISQTNGAVSILAAVRYHVARLLLTRGDRAGLGVLLELLDVSDWADDDIGKDALFKTYQECCGLATSIFGATPGEILADLETHRARIAGIAFDQPPPTAIDLHGGE